MDARETVIAAAADLHGELPEVPACDLLVLAGDLVPYAVEHDHARSAEWFATHFTHWLEDAPAREVVAIAGNHDFWATEIPAGVHERLFGAPWTFLRDAETTTATGLRVYGTPWTPDVYTSAFEAPVGELARIWSQIPAGVDVLIVHGPPRGHGDQLAEADAEPTRMGTVELLAAITRARPRLVLYGHAHQGSGYRAEDPPGTRLANVTVRTDYTGGLHAVSTFRLTGPRSHPR
jgi:Icc-related predicted phosphoesterase